MEKITAKYHPITGGTKGLTLKGRVQAWLARHRWRVVAGSVLALAITIFAAGAVEAKVLGDNDIAEGESAGPIKLLNERLDYGRASTKQLVFSTPSLGVSNLAYPSTAAELVRDLRAMPEVAGVVIYYETGQPIKILDERFDIGGAPKEQLVFSSSSLDVSNLAYPSTVAELVRDLRAMPEVAAVVVYYKTGQPRLVSADRHMLSS